jgi:hypothetical protein
MGTRGFFPQYKQLEHETDDSPPSRAEDECNYIFIPHMPSWCPQSQMYFYSYYCIMMYCFISHKLLQALKCRTAMNNTYTYTTIYSLTYSTNCQIKGSHITHEAQVRNKTTVSSYTPILRTRIVQSV